MSLVQRIRSSQFLRGSFFVFSGSFVVNFGNFLLSLILARLLGSVDFGNLGAIIAVISLFGVPLSVFNLYIIKTVSVLWGASKKAKIIGLYSYFFPNLLLLGTGIALMLIFFRIPIAAFLNQKDSSPVMIASLLFITSSLGVLNNAVIDGILAFKLIAVNSIIEIIFKVTTSIFLVLSGLGLIGAVLGYLSASLARIISQIIEIKLIFRKEKAKIYKFDKSQLKSFLPIVATTMILTSFFNADIIMVKHYFDPLTSGNYVALSTAGKIILYAMGPVITVMFPLVSSRKSAGYSYLMPLLGSLLISVGLSLSIMLLFFLAPEMIVRILFGNKYPLVVPHLTHFSFFIAFYSLNTILTYFLLSASYHRSLFFLFTAALSQWLLLLVFHNSIYQVININILVSIIYFILAFYFFLIKEYNNLLNLYVKLKPKKIINV